MSDSDTSDSDSGIRFKTTSTRYKSDGADKYGSSARPSRSSLDAVGHGSSRRRSRSRDREHRRTSDRRTKSRSRSRSRDHRRRRDDRRHRSRTRSPAKRSSDDRRDHRSKSSSKASSHSAKETFSSVEPSKVEPTKVLDISVSSLSSQDDHLGKDDAPDYQFGPALPPSMHSKAPERKPLIEEEITEAIGPALPPHLMARKVQDKDHSPEQSKPTIGPALPPAGFTPAKETTGGDTSESELSPFSEEEPDADENDDFIGPMPGASTSKAQLELEKRALEMKLRRYDVEDSKASNGSAREDWMLELPDIRKVADMGLGARQFRTREKLEIGDRSVWTDTPSERERKKASGGGHSSRDAKRDHEQEIEQFRIAERDKQQEEQVKRHKKKHKRDKSLLDIHQKKLKKEKKNKDEPPTRRPFDRNVDLHANRFDDAQKKAIMKKAQLLDTRFSSGGSKYL